VSSISASLTTFSQKIIPLTTWFFESFADNFLKEYFHITVADITFISSVIKVIPL
jgi:hypothetical protein